MRKGVFLYIEDELCHYHETIKEIERLKDDIIFGGSSDENSGGGKGSQPSDVTGKKAIALVTNAKLSRLEQITESIESVFQRLQPEKQQLIRLAYWTRPKLLTWEGVALKLHITKRTAGRWRKEIIYAIAERGGFK